MSSANNSSLSPEFSRLLETHARRAKVFEFAVMDVALKLVCCIGLAGNALNLAVFIRRRLGREGLEGSVSHSLTALAVSDLCVCLWALPLSVTVGVRTSWLLSYAHIWASAMVTAFLAASIWLTLSITVCRYIAVWQPLRARSWLTRRKLRGAIVGIFLLAFGLHAPFFFKFKIVRREPCGAEPVCYISKRRNFFSRKLFSLVYPWVCATVVNLLPLLVMIVGNVKLILAYRSSLRQRNHLTGSTRTGADSAIASGSSNVVADGSSKTLVRFDRASRRQKKRQQKPQQQQDSLTPLLVAATVIFFVTIAPAELTNFFCRQFITGQLQDRLKQGDSGAVSSYYGVNSLIHVVTLSQVIGCAANFILYCVVSASFRKSMLVTLCPRLAARLTAAETSRGIRYGGNGGAGTGTNFTSGVMTSASSQHQPHQPHQHPDGVSPQSSPENQGNRVIAAQVLQQRDSDGCNEETLCLAEMRPSAAKPVVAEGTDCSGGAMN